MVVEFRRHPIRAEVRSGEPNLVDLAVEKLAVGRIARVGDTKSVCNRVGVATGS